MLPMMTSGSEMLRCSFAYAMLAKIADTMLSLPPLVIAPHTCTRKTCSTRILNLRTNSVGKLC